MSTGTVFRHNSVRVQSVLSCEYIAQSAVPTTPRDASVQHAAEDKMVQNGTQCTVKNDDALHQQYSLKGKIVVQNHTECEMVFRKVTHSAK